MMGKRCTIGAKAVLSAYTPSIPPAATIALPLHAIVPRADAAPATAICPSSPPLPTRATWPMPHFAQYTNPRPITSRSHKLPKGADASHKGCAPQPAVVSATSTQ